MNDPNDPNDHNDYTQLARQNHLYETIISNTPDLVYAFDLNYRFTFVNEAILQMWGRTFEESIGKRLLEVGYEPWHAEMHEREIDQVVRTKQPIRGEVAFPHAKLGKRMYDYILVPVLNEKNEVVSVAGTTRDITEQKKNEYSNALLSAIINDSDDAIISKNLNGIITSWNRSAEHLFGYTAEEAIGQPITMLIPEDRQDEEIQILARLNKGERIQHFETIRQRKDGSLLNISLTVSPVRNSSGKIVGASKIARDITRQKQVEKEFKAMNETLEERIKERTASLVSYQTQLRSLAFQLSKAEEYERQRLATELHDNLGQILAVSKMELEIMQKQAIPELLSEGFNILSKLTDDAIRYTRELMSDLKPPPGMDQEEMGHILTWLADKMNKHGLTVTVAGDEQSIPINDEIRLTLLQGVRELLFNVVKHAQTDKAEITVSRNNEWIEVTVSDEGNGFNPDEQKESETKDGGFGLFNIRERMDLLGGSLKIISEAGEGTKAILAVPVKPGTDAGSQDYDFPLKRPALTESDAHYQPGGKVKVLLADDHEMIRTGLRKMIEQESDLMVIAEASDGKEAVERAHEISPDVIVMDVDMPGINGVEATRQILSFAPHARIIGLSLHKDIEVETTMRSAGASVYLTKNDVFETLCATIRSEANLGKNKL